MLLLLKVISERCGGLPIDAVMLNKLVCGSDGYRLAFALLRIRLSSLDAMRIQLWWLKAAWFPDKIPVQVLVR